MAFPHVDIELANGQLGATGVQSSAIPALILTGTGTTEIPVGTPKVVYSLADVEALGITADSQAFAHKQLSEFYQAFERISGSPICELYIMLATNTATLCDMVDASKVYAPVLLRYSKGRVRILGVGRLPGSGYTPDLTGGIDKDSLDALAFAQTLGNSQATTNQAPLRILIEGRAFKAANLGDLTDLKQKTSNRAGIVLWSTENTGSSSIGYTLGVKSALPFVRKLSRVKNGAHEFPGGAFVGDTAVQDLTGLETVHNKGYITMRELPRLSGYYFSGEPMAVRDQDDYAILSRGLVIDEAQCIAYSVFVQELEEDVEVDADGQLTPGYKATLENTIVQAIREGLAGQISGVRFSIPDGQNIISNATTNAELGIIPKGYQTYITIKLGFINPALS